MMTCKQRPCMVFIISEMFLPFFPCNKLKWTVTNSSNPKLIIGKMWVVVGFDMFCSVHVTVLYLLCCKNNKKNIGWTKKTMSRTREEKKKKKHFENIDILLSFKLWLNSENIFSTSLLDGNVWVPDSPPSSRGSRPSRSPACPDWVRPPSHSGWSATPTIFNFIWTASRLYDCALHYLLFWQPKNATFNFVVLNKEKSVSSNDLCRNISVHCQGFSL